MTPIQRNPINSSTIASVGYDNESYVLEIEFVGGRVYQYLDVPETVVQELMSAESPGSYFNAFIRNNYRYAQM